MPHSSTVSCLLTHWGRVTHICVSKLTSIASDNGLSPGRRQAIIWTNAGILLIEPLGTNFSEILIEIHTFSFKKMHLKMSSVKWRPFCPGLNVLIEGYFGKMASYRGNTLLALVQDKRQYFTSKYHLISNILDIFMTTNILMWSKLT